MRHLTRSDLFVIALILGVGLFLRTYRLDRLLGFYYDQGRDALVIRDFIVNHKPFLIGPTTGIEGIFLGPLYYLALVPWYWLGQGNPVFPAAYHSVTAVLAIAILAKVGIEAFGKRTGFVFMVLGSFSYWTVVASRWLANPTQLMLASSLAILGLWKILRGQKNYWLLVSAAVAAGLQLEAAGATFFLPAIAVFLLANRQTVPGPKIIISSLGIFLVSLLPQLFFDWRHDHILLKSFSRFLISEHSFGGASVLPQIEQRLNFLIGALTNKLFPNPTIVTGAVLVLLAISLVRFRHLFSQKVTKMLLIWLLTPLVGLTIYQGNHGYVWDYYLTGIYLVFLLLVSVLVSKWATTLAGKSLLAIFLALFFWANLPVTRNYLIAGTDGPTNVVLGNEVDAVKWVLESAKGKSGQYNLDEYVPPVIPYSYEYLFWWLSRQQDTTSTQKIVPTLYTLFEVDPPHPERLAAWLKRQEGIGIVEKVATFGGVTAQRRTRLPEAPHSK